MTTKSVSLLSLFIFFHFAVSGQTITNNIQLPTSINADGSEPEESAMLEVQATDKGMLLPRLLLDDASTAAPVSNPATGLLIYNEGGVEPDGFYYWDGSQWSRLIAGSLMQVSDLDDDTHIAVDDGSDPDEISFKINGSQVMRLDSATLHLDAPGSSLFIGKDAGIHDDGTFNDNTFLGFNAGYSNTTGSENTFVGRGAGFGNTTGIENTFIGTNAGYLNGQGYRNVFLGRGAGADNTSGHQNTFIGQGAGRSTTIGSKNTFIGQNSGFFNTTGDRNTFIGIDAAQSNVSGSSNIAIGMAALFSNTQGSGLVAVGDSALYNQATAPSGNYGNLAIGLSAGRSNTTGYYNTFIGERAGYNNQFGIRNTFVGRQAGYANTLGQKNTFLGEDAGWKNTDGSFNTFVGQSAGFNNETGEKNTFLGQDAGRYNTMGNNNTFLGQNAGLNNENGLNNTFVGLSAGYFNTSGSYNTFIGVQAGEDNSTGIYNTFLGRYAGHANTTANKNTFLGEDAGRSHQTGDFNTFVGENAGYDHVSGSSNTFLGQRAGKGNASGSGNIFIGTQAGFNETGSHKLYIESTDSGTPLIYGEFDNDIVRVNGKLEVTGDIKMQDSGSSASPTAGTIRWNNATQDFEGYNGIEWVSLTKINRSWGDNNNITENEQLSASDGVPEAEFGVSVSISGDYAIIGAYVHDIGGNIEQGQAYIFHRSGSSWTEQAILVASDGAANDYFGVSVSIDGDYALVGAMFHDTGGNIHQGQAYIFHRSGTTWAEQAILAASDGETGDYFGNSVDISGDYAIVGAPSHNIGGNIEQGQAYIFHRSGSSWTEQAMLIASDGATEDLFGYSVSISGNNAIVGAYGHNTGGNSDQGQAYIFFLSGTTWAEKTILAASDGATGDMFGFSVSISGNYSIVGAFNHDTGGTHDQGQAYIYWLSGTTWGEQAILVASDGAWNDQFGYSVSISGNFAIIGADYHHTLGNNEQGQAYVFHRTGSSWTEQASLGSSDGAAGDLFGISVSISSDYAIVGAFRHDTNGSNNQGKAYIFNK